MPLYRGLLISTSRNEERSASSEIHFVLTNRLEIDESLFTVHDTRISGLITLSMNPSIDTHEVVRELMSLEDDEAYFMHCLKIRPVDYVVQADIESVVNAIKELDIQREGSFRITVSKRHTPLASMDLIMAVAKLFSNPVNLSNPDWEILIEIVADKLGFTVMEPDLLFSTQLAFHEDDDDVPNWFLD